MKSFISKISSIVMAIVIVLSTMSYTIDMRYCDGDLLDTAVGTSTDICDSEFHAAAAKNCCKVKENCCSIEQIIVEGLDALMSYTYDDLKFEQKYVHVAQYYSYLQPFKVFAKNIVPNYGNSPPRIVSNIQKLHQVYLL